MNPLKQGLKQIPLKISLHPLIMHLSMNPLKQGLKRLRLCAFTAPFASAFIHESIKTRVETLCAALWPARVALHLSVNPLKQGLKLPFLNFNNVYRVSIYP